MTEAAARYAFIILASGKVVFLSTSSMLLAGQLGSYQRFALLHRSSLLFDI